MIYKSVLVLGFAALAACQPTVPDSAAGVGFGDYQSAQAEQAARDAQLQGGPLVPSGAISDETVDAGSAVPGQKDAGTDIASNAAGSAEQAAPPSPKLDNPGISDEQDFQAVASRETIESDKERLEAQRKAYKVIEPTALPDRPRNTGPSIVEFALSTTNNVGEQRYRRLNVFAKSRFDRNCAKYASSDLAQEAFLKAGGPEKDPMGLDPDGDGFACYWDPAPFRLAVRQ